MKRTIIFLVVFALVYVPFMFTFSFDNVNGTSMLPTYNNGDLLLINRRASVKLSSIITIGLDSSTHLVKRVVGVPGDSIEIRDGHLFRNGKLVKEDYILEQKWKGEVPEQIIKTGEIFVLGDNRNSSTDSRNLGCLKINEIKGVVAVDITKKIGLRYEHLIIIIVILLISTLTSYFLKVRKLKKFEVKEKESDVDENEFNIFENSRFD